MRVQYRSLRWHQPVCIPDHPEFRGIERSWIFSGKCIFKGNIRYNAFNLLNDVVLYLKHF